MYRDPDSYDQVAANDRQMFRWSETITAGASAYHQLDPGELAARLEEFDPEHEEQEERGKLRGEIFSGFAEYLFADGPDPAEVRMRLEGFFQSFHPVLAENITGPHEWCARETVERVLEKYAAKLAEVRRASRSRGALSEWYAELEKEVDFKTVAQMLVGLVEFLASEGHTWRHLTAVAYCIAKALRPALIAGMSLHDIALLSGDEGGRATPCDRIKRLYNRRVEKAGSRATKVHFQKSETVTRKYREAQKGNSNRSHHRKKTKPTQRSSKP